jgi:hypothetical protein
MRPTFSFDKHDKLFADATHLSNGHWMISRMAAASKAAPVQLRKLAAIPPGSYPAGYAPKREARAGDCPNMSGVLDLAKKATRAIWDEPQGVLFHKPKEATGKDKGKRVLRDIITAYVFGYNGAPSERQRIGIAPGYVPLLRMGYGFASDALGPIRVCAENDPDSEVLAIIMPVKI